MGKIKRKRLRVSRYSPTHVDGSGKEKGSNSDSLLNVSDADLNPDLKDVCDPHSSHDINQQEGSYDNFSKAKGGLKTAEEKILCGIAEERVTGLNMVAAFALDPEVASSMITKKMVVHVAPLLRDESSQVRLAAAGALRNLCAWGSDEDIDTIVEQNVLNPLSRLLKTYETNVPNEASKQTSCLTYSKGVAHSMEEKDPHDLIFIHATNALWSLCECNEEALETFNHEGLVTVLLKHINPFAWSYSISLAAADCLLCVSENNSKTASAILPLGNTLLSLVFKAMESDCDAFGLQFAIVITGVLLNINYWTPTDANFRQVLEVVNKVLELEADSQLQLHHAGDGITKASAQERFEHTISAQIVAFEILSNTCAPDEDEEEEACDDDSDEMEMEDEMNASNGSSSRQSPNALSIEVLEGIKYFGLVEKTYKKVGVPQVTELGKNEEENKLIVEKFHQLQIRALQCFQNMVICLQMEDFGGSEGMYSTWVTLGQMSFAGSAKTDLLEATSGAMRAIIQKCSEKECPKQFHLSSNELKAIFEAGLSCEMPSVRSNLCRMVGTLGCSFITHDAQKQQLTSTSSVEFLSPIAEFLLKVSSDDSTLWVRAEALDVLIDLFSDDRTDHLASQTRLVDRLRDMHPHFKAKFNQQKKKLGDHRPLVLTVRDNLAAFIKYKGPRTAKLNKMIH